MPVPVHRRTYDAFLSHAHNDRIFVDKLYEWLTEAGLKIWYDAKKMAGGPISETLQTAVEECRGVLLVASEDSIARGWVKREIGIAVDESTLSADFRIIALRVAGANVSNLVRDVSWIDVPKPELTPELAASILRAFHPVDGWPDPQTGRDVYVSLSWRPSDNASALAACGQLASAGFRLIGDAKQSVFEGERRQSISWESIMSSCGAFVGIIPYRQSENACATEDPYQYFLRELDFAVRAGIPWVVIADPRVRRKDGDDSGWYRMDTVARACPPAVTGAINDLWADWKKPCQPHYVFLAVDLDAPSSHRNSELRDIIERVTGMPTVVGNEIHEDPLQPAIIRTIKNAFLVVADITGGSEDTFNLDVCIEAGMARATGANLELLACGKSRRPPFMLRGAQMPTYVDPVDQLGLIHRVVRPYRRRVINAELSGQMRSYAG